jgi:hypothetical protein
VEYVVLVVDVEAMEGYVVLAFILPLLLQCGPSRLRNVYIGSDKSVMPR